uniref:myosin light chain 3, skeletal muscle isoform-like n=1 Tax=Styela clava TaxID=7725 RepID=UPI00193AB871|nr:myosin light chain 3, skeletal muscle isoform-like [Styela clava]
MAAVEFSEEKIENIKEAFELFDTTGDGKIAYHQVGDVTRAMGEDPTNEDVTKFMGNPSADDLKTKRITVEEFLPIFQKIIQEGQKGTFEDFVEGLRVFDKDGKGTVMGAEIRHVLTTLGEKLTSAQVSLMMKGQEDNTGEMNYEAFSKFLLSEGEPEKK